MQQQQYNNKQWGSYNKNIIRNMKRSYNYGT